LAENSLYVKPEKRKWKVREVGFLGVVIIPEGIRMEEKKVKDILDWLTPKGVKDIQKFLGLVNYYCQFIKDFIAIARPLHDIVKKDQNWEWMEKQEGASKELKKRFIKEPVLATLDLDKKIRMEVNASDYVTDSVLFMECEDRKWKLVAYLSKLLNEMERNYEIHNKEILVVIQGLEN